MIDNPMFGVLLISIVTNFVLSALYKFTTDQEELKKINEDLKKINEEFKEAQKNKNQKEIMKLQGRMLEINNKKMKSSMKTMMISFLIIIPVFLYLLPNLYGDVTVNLNESLEGVINYQGTEMNVHVEEEPFLISIDGEKKHADDIIQLKGDEFTVKEFDKDKKLLLLKRVAVNLPFPLPIWGSHIGWLGWYILISIPFTTLFRKALGVVQ